MSPSACSPRCPATSVAGRSSPRISTSRCAPCCLATCSRRRATGCSWPTRSRAASRSSTRTWWTLANALPPSYKLRGLDEKHVLKRVATGLVPDEIIRRPKQPYRAPDAACFVGAGRAGLGRRRAQRARGQLKRGCSTLRQSAACGGSVGATRPASRCPTPITWRSSAFCPRPCSSSSSFVARRSNLAPSSFRRSSIGGPATTPTVPSRAAAGR